MSAPLSEQQLANLRAEFTRPALSPGCYPRHVVGALLAEVDRLSQLAAPQGDVTVYRASHDSIVMGLYTTAAEARAHCVAEERRAQPTGVTLVCDWIEDPEDGVAELVTTVDGETETVTGYVVEALTVAAAYDPDGDE